VSEVVANGSDEALHNFFYDPNLGCKSFEAPNLADPTGKSVVGSLALNELQAAVASTASPALKWSAVPPQDPMVLLNAEASLSKQNAYRAAVNQPPTMGGIGEETQFCIDFLGVTAPALITDLPYTFSKTSPDPANGIDLFTFVCQRFQVEFFSYALFTFH
jgi:hypothetical protein